MKKDNQIFDLISEERSRQMRGIELIASEKTPQTLLILSDDDRGVKPTNSTLLYNRLKQLGIPASIHILPEGGHGWGMRDSFRYKPMWQSIVLDYLNHIKK